MEVPSVDELEGDEEGGDDSGAPEKDRSEGTSAAALEADGEGKE
jgi:hypothetical protein